MAQRPGTPRAEAGQAKALKELIDPIRVRLVAGKLPRQCQVFHDGKRRHQVKLLEYEADMAAAKTVAL